MNMVIIKHAVLTVVFLLTFFSVVNGSEIEDLAATLAEYGGGIQSGRNISEGIYLVVAVEVNGDNLETAKFDAQKQIAEFLGSKVTSEEVYKEWETVLTSGNNSQIDSGSDWKSVVEVSVSECLKGARFINVIQISSDSYACYLLSENSTKIASTLKSRSASRNNSLDGIVTVNSIGFADVGDKGKQKAVEQAVEFALRGAIEQVAGSLIMSTTIATEAVALRKHATSRSVGLVDTYRTIEVIESNKSLTVKVEVDVAIGRLLDDYTAITRGLDTPLILVAGAESIVPQVQEMLAGLGFEVAQWSGSEDFILDIDLNCTPVEHPIEKIQGERVRITASFSRVLDRSVLFSISNDPRYSSNFLSNETIRRERAVSSALNGIKEDLHEKIDGVFQGMVSNGQKITIEFENYSNSKKVAFDGITGLINKMSNVNGVDVGVNAIMGEASIDLFYIGEIEDLEFELRNYIQSSLSGRERPSLDKMSRGKIIYSF